jgi:hypothetical protein
MKCEVDINELTTYERPLKAIDRNATIMGTLKVVMDTFTFAQGWARIHYTDKHPWNGSLEAITWQGFKQEDFRKRFR